MKYRSLLFLCCSILFLLLSAGSVSAQNEDPFEAYRQRMDNRFEAEKARIDKTFSEYRDKMNKEFSSYLEREWKKISLNSGCEYPFKPEPVPVADTVPVNGGVPLPYDIPDVIPEQEEQPSPIEPIESDKIIPDDILPDLDEEEVIIPEEDMILRPDESRRRVPYTPENNEHISFTYLGNKCQIRAPKERNVQLQSTSNDAISKAWTVLSTENYNDMLIDCLCIRESLSLCDWAFYQMVRSFTDSYLSSESFNEAVLMQAYIMAQIGYKIRLARQNGRLCLMLGSSSKIFGIPFYTSSDGCFYCFDPDYEDRPFQFCDYVFPGERDFSMRMKHHPKAPEASGPMRRVVSEAYPQASVSVSTNRNLISFYDSYPQCSWEYQAASSFSEGLKKQLYPSLEKAIAGLTEVQGVNVLLNFVQTGFEYMKDDDQFGREKSFFGDETFHYPYCDCEDRSIAFSILVRELMHLDVVLLDYPTHIATAVKFTEDVNGDYFDFEGSRYVICDPTYIGAPIGKSMPRFRDTPATILKIE